MRIGIVLPHLGVQATPAALLTAARRAEELEYDNLWVIERLLKPTNPRSKYPVTPDGSLPKYYDHVLTPLETLSYVAGHTSRIGLGTGVLVMPLHNPIMLARQLATIDYLSGGRLRLGLGQGWSLDEIEAAGGTFEGRAARADEFIQVLKTIWTSDPAEHAGPTFTLPRSILNPKPVQTPHPPIYMAAYVPSALKRTGRLANGWMPSGVPLGATWQLMGQVREAALAAGRDPNALELIMFADGTILDRSPGPDRPDFVGTLDEIARDVATARDLGVTEIIFMSGFSSGDLDLNEYMRALEQLGPLVREPTTARR
jgi:probable F420-dependent oxidoreductase